MYALRARQLTKFASMWPRLQGILSQGMRKVCRVIRGRLPLTSWIHNVTQELLEAFAVSTCHYNIPIHSMTFHATPNPMSVMPFHGTPFQIDVQIF